MKKAKRWAQLLEDYVNGRDETTGAQAVGAVGRHIAALSAMRRSRLRKQCRGSAKATVDHGKRCIVMEQLSTLFREGKIRRLRQGVYGPREPQAFEPQQTA